MRALYIGILTPGTTSRMRAETLAELLPDAEWRQVDTDVQFRRAAWPLRSLAFRWKTGPVTTATNRQVITSLADRNFDLVWVDKGVQLWPETVADLRKRAANLVHFTPDTAFHANRSRHFKRSAGQYDLLVTTKSFELPHYASLVDGSRVLLTTQAYDARLHTAPRAASTRQPVACFIGQCEPDRERGVRKLLEAGVPVRVGGVGWRRFVSRHRHEPGLHFLGDRVLGPEYAAEYGRAMMGLGFLSKRFPELHTTRTFEIPACSAVLATERTVDTRRFFGADEVLFFEDHDDLAARARALLADPGTAEAVARRGHRRVVEDGRDYASVLSGVLRRLGLYE